MYEIILKNIIDDMADFGLISTIVVSDDVFCEMEKKQIKHLEEFLDSSIKWLIISDKKEYYSFIYSVNPVRSSNV